MRLQMMKLYYSAMSPYVRKVLTIAHHLGIADRIEKLPCAPNPIQRDRSILPFNPLAKAPTLITDDGVALHDSQVIIEYLNSIVKGNAYPGAGSPEKWRILTEHALFDGMLDATILARLELAFRPENLRWSAWVDGQMQKVDSGLQACEAHHEGLHGRVDLATVTLGCLLGYLDFRFIDYDWRARHPGIAAWYSDFREIPAMKLTAPDL